MKSHTVALDRALSKLGILSRSLAREAIKNGRVKINGKIITNPEQRFIPEKIQVEIDGQDVQKAKDVYILFYKPVGYVTTTKDEKNRPTVFDLLPKEFGKLTSVGRLDMNTSGLLLLTTNTQVANFLTDPKNKIERKYIVTVEGLFSSDKIEQCLEGIEDNGELLKAKKINILKSSQKESLIEIILTQGKNREIRRLMETLENPVIKLKRVSFGNITLNLKNPGEWEQVENFMTLISPKS
jgi:23S rRNA pseudouridine2605 synthase